jgi:hypothetical protein
MTTETTIETTEVTETTKKRAKEWASYNVAEMSFQCGGIKRVLTLNHDHELFLRLALIGARNVIIDSVAPLTIKAGFTVEQRNSGMEKTMLAINEGRHVEREKSDKTPAVTVKTLNLIEDVERLVMLRTAVKGGLFSYKFTGKQLDILALEDGENHE